MKAVTKSQISILDFGVESISDNLAVIMPILFAKVQTVYIAYRQCYSKNPTVPSNKVATDVATQACAQSSKWVRSFEDLSAGRPNLGTLFLDEHGVPTKFTSVTELEDNKNKCIYKDADAEFNTALKEYVLNGDEYKAIYDYVENHPEYSNFFSMCWFIKKHINHESPLEHLSFSVRITDVSRAMTHQWVRSRIAAHSQQSQRYVKCTEDDTYVIPPTVNRDFSAKTIFNNTIEYVESQIKKLKELGIPDEDIRYLYPNAFSSQIVTTMNLRNWMHFFNERCCTRAQTEIRVTAWKILNKFSILLPFILDDAGPKCVKNKRCPESKPCNFEKSFIK